MRALTEYRKCLACGRAASSPSETHCFKCGRFMYPMSTIYVPKTTKEKEQAE